MKNQHARFHRDENGGLRIMHPAPLKGERTHDSKSAKIPNMVASGPGKKRPSLLQSLWDDKESERLGESRVRKMR